jgi:hypothetical protein
MRRSRRTSTCRQRRRRGHDDAGRRVGNDYTLVSVLVDIAIEDMVVDSMAPHLPELKPRTTSR